MSKELWAKYELALLALVIWREARSEGPEAMLAVGCSIRNRVQRPSWWGKNYISVITKKWQYSSIGDPNDPQLIKYPQVDDAQFTQALEIAQSVLHGTVSNPVPGADSFFDDRIPRPYWASDETYVGKIGKLEFHDIDNDMENIV